MLINHWLSWQGPVSRGNTCRAIYSHLARDNTRLWRKPPGAVLPASTATRILLLALSRIAVPRVMFDTLSTDIARGFDDPKRFAILPATAPRSDCGELRRDAVFVMQPAISVGAAAPRRGLTDFARAKRRCSTDSMHAEAR
jgi:hypothetical protein